MMSIYFFPSLISLSRTSSSMFIRHKSGFSVPVPDLEGRALGFSLLSFSFTVYALYYLKYFPSIPNL